MTCGNLTRNAGLLVGLLALCTSLSLQAQTVEPGLWEFKSDAKMPGMPDLAAQQEQMRRQMAQLPPEARRQMEQHLASMGMSVQQPGAIRVCIGPDQVKQPIQEGQRDGSCTYTQVSRSGSTWQGRMVCTDPKSEGRFTTTVHSPQHFSTLAVLKGEKGDMQMKTEARRISGNCGNLKPMSPK